MAESPAASLASSSSDRVSSRQLVMNLVAGGLGTGMFSLPWSMAGASLLPGLVMTLGVVALNAWTIMILVQAAEEQQVFDLGSLLGKLPGPLLPGRLGRRLPSLGTFMRVAMNVMVWVVLMGSLVSYLIVMHDSAKPFLEGTLLAERRTPLITAAALLVFPLCFLDQRYLSYTSLVAVLVNVYLIVLLAGLFGQRATSGELPPKACLFGIGLGSVAMLATLAQCVIIQMCVLPMYEMLEDRRPEVFRRSLSIAFLALATIFGLFACLGYLTFGEDVHPNVLLNLPDSPMSKVAQLGVIAVVSAIYPLMVIPMVAPFRHAAGSAEQPKRNFVPLVTSLIVGLSYIGALFIESLGFVNVVDGSLCVGTFTALCPSLVGMKLLRGPLPRSSPWMLAMYGLLAVGMLNAALGLVFTDNYRADLASHCSLISSAGRKAAQSFLVRTLS